MKGLQFFLGQKTWEKSTRQGKYHAKSFGKSVNIPIFAEMKRVIQFLFLVAAVLVAWAQQPSEPVENLVEACPLVKLKADSMPLLNMAQGVTDVHSHLITPEFLSALEDEKRLLDEGFPLPKYDAKTHLKWMDEAGVQTSVLTLAAPQPTSAKVVRSTNEVAARLKTEHPGRFLFCAALPLPDVGAAIREAVYALDTLKADGIKLATNVQGQYLGAPELDTLFAVLNERRAVVILHPHRPEPVNRQVMQQTPLAMQEYLSETTRAVANMISRNVLARYKNIKVVVPHCGAYLPLAIPRMKSLTPVMQANKMVGKIDYDANLAALYYDLAGAHSPEVIRMLLTITTPDHLLYGSDYPYVAPQVLTQSLRRMKQYLTTEPDLAPYRDMILWKNAQRLFQISQ